MGFKEGLKKRTETIEGIIPQYAPEQTGLYKNVCRAMNYSLMAGGKRLRPMLMQETWRLFGGKEEKLLQPFMAAIEMIHTYSLIHDDLPALDNDDYRRGKKTSHKVFGEAMAILAGDGLLNYAFETACKAMDAVEDEKQLAKVAQALRILAVKPGLAGMLGGQVVDVEMEGKPIGKDVLDFIHERKTSALIECSMMIGAILAGAGGEEVTGIEQAARKIGLAFQIQDDILDVTSSLEVLGKPVYSDEKNEKTTYVSLMGIEAAAGQVEKLSNDALSIIRGLCDAGGYANPSLEELLKALIHRKK